MIRPQRIWTIGHSTLLATDLIEMLRAHGIALLADVNRESLTASLMEVGIDYLHFPELGGRREPRPDSVNTGLARSWIPWLRRHNPPAVPP